MIVPARSARVTAYVDWLSSLGSAEVSLDYLDPLYHDLKSLITLTSASSHLIHYFFCLSVCLEAECLGSACYSSLGLSPRTCSASVLLTLS